MVIVKPNMEMSVSEVKDQIKTIKLSLHNVGRIQSLDLVTSLHIARLLTDELNRLENLIRKER